MFGVRTARRNAASGTGWTIYDDVRAFLLEHRLCPEPENYALAYRVLAEPDGPLALAVTALTEGGVRLTGEDVRSLTREPGADENRRGDGADLAAGAERQAAAFQEMMQAMQVETRDFGQDLAASAAAIEKSRSNGALAPLGEELRRITATMLGRVRVAESRLDAATREARELRAKLEEARTHARRDALTELPNRRAFEEAYAAQVASGATITLAICDIDHFKSVNDRFGHAVGDRVLQTIAGLLKESCSGHFVARFGGEEFVVMFAGVPACEAETILDGARQLVESKQYKLRESDTPLGTLTFSAGLAPARSGDTLQDLFQRTDALLYAAKAGGRNRIAAGH